MSLTRSKRIIFLLTYFLTGTAIFSQDLQKLIPANVSGVVSMDGSSFFRKVDIDQINRLDMFQDMDQRTKGRKGSKYDEYSKIYKSPTSLGLNLNSKLYFYFENSEDTTEWGRRYMYSTLLVSLNKSKKFENFIKKVTDDPIQKMGSYKYVLNSRGNIIAWNSSHLMILLIDSYSDNRDSLILKQMSRLINLTPEKSIKSNKNFMEAQASKFDFHYWMNFESFFSGMHWSKAMSFPLMKDLPFIGADFYKGYYFQLALNFNNGDFNISSKQILNEESAKKVENVYGKGLNNEILKFVHKDHLLGLAAYSLNMKGIKAIVDTAIHDTIKTQINNEFIGILYGKKIKEDPQIKSIKDQIDSLYSNLYSDSYAPASSVSPAVDTAYSVTDSVAIADEYYDNNYDTIPENDNYIEDTSSVTVPVDTIMYDTTEVTYDKYEVNEETYDATDSTSAIAPPDVDTYKTPYASKYAKIDSLRKIESQLIHSLQEKKAKELDFTINDIFEIFQGDVMGGITDLYFIPKKYTSYEYDEEELVTKEVEKTKSEPFPEYLVALTLNKTEKAKSFLSRLHKDSLLQKKDDYYFISAGDYTIYTFISGNILLITNNKDLLEKNPNGFESKDFIAKDVQDIILNKNISVYISPRDIFARLPLDTYSKQEHDIYTLLMNSMGTFTATGDNYKNNISNSEVIFRLTNKMDNSFYEILRIINEVYKINKARY